MLNQKIMRISALQAGDMKADDLNTFIQSNFGLISYDRKLRCTHWNDFIVRLTGMKSEDAVVMGAEELTPLLNETIHPIPFTRVLQGESFTLPDAFHPASGTRSELWTSTRMSPFRDESETITGIVCVVTDITLRKNTIENLLRFDAKLFTTADSLGDLRWSVDKHNLLTSFNEDYRKFSQTVFKLTPELHMDLPTRFHEEKLPGWSAFYERVFKGERFSTEFQYGNSANRIYYEITFSPEWDKNGISGASIFAKNISARRRSEEAFKSVSDRFRDLYDNAPCGYHSLNNEGLIVEINQTELNWLGYTKEEVVGKMNVNEILSPSCKDSFQENYISILRDRGVRDLELEFMRKNGSIFFVLLNSSISLDSSGKLSSTRAMTIDITEKKLAKMRIQQTEAKFTTLLEHLHEGVLFTDEYGKVIYINTWLAGITGFTPSELTSGTCAEARDFMDMLGALIRALTIKHQEQSYSGEIKLTRRNGTEFPSNIHLTKISEKSGHLIGIMATFSDLSLYSVYEEQIRSKEEQFREILESSTDLIMIITQDMKVAYVSPSLERILGYKPQERVGKPGVENIHPEDLSRVLETLGKAASSPGEVYTEKYRARHKDGSWKYIESSGKAVISQEYGGMIFIINARDISEHTKTELQLQYKINELNTFMYKASHDLRAPLSSLLGLIAIARVEKDANELPAYFKMIDESTRKMDKILIDLVSITKITQGVPEISEIHLDQLIREVVSSLENTPGYKAIHFSTSLSLKKPFFSDIKLLQSIIQNLLDNSAKYRSLERESFIKIHAEDIPGGVRIDISDNGIGIPRSFHKRVFEMFYRATTVSNGTGLGLYIVKSTVEKLGGVIDLESIEGTGTTFSLTLPNSGPES